MASFRSAKFRFMWKAKTTNYVLKFGSGTIAQQKPTIKTHIHDDMIFLCCCCCCCSLMTFNRRTESLSVLCHRKFTEIQWANTNTYLSKPIEYKFSTKTLYVFTRQFCACLYNWTINNRETSYSCHWFYLLCARSRYSNTIDIINMCDGCD